MRAVEEQSALEEAQWRQRLDSSESQHTMQIQNLNQTIVALTQVTPFLPSYLPIDMIIHNSSIMADSASPHYTHPFTPLQDFERVNHDLTHTQSTVSQLERSSAEERERAGAAEAAVGRLEAELTLSEKLTEQSQAGWEVGRQHLFFQCRSTATP